MVKQFQGIFFVFTLSSIVVSCKTMVTASSRSLEVPTTSYQSQVWVADQGNGTYKNPILYADYSDPDVIRVGDDYFMTASSFHCMPGMPILHSKDLVNWRLINNAVTKQVPGEFFDKPQHGYGI